MSTHTVEKLVVRETGWAKARRQRGRGLRTCLPALETRSLRRRAGADADSNIVRGED
ncbi:hypothetical protein [Streptomyces spongiae]|uniref:hypothetical protein n=1 Tax=Streptomyces spongiae TaxID=565072 RepID=UPI002AD51709|nr:hypothetical protein [Streptomyces spongiae]